MYVAHGVRWLLSVVLVFTAMPVFAGVAAAQDDDELETWESDFFPITITYHPDLWQGRSTSSFDSNERFQITARATNFLLQAFTDDDLDPESCVESYVASIERVDGVSNMEEAEREPMPDGIAGGAELLVSYEFLWPGREEPVAMMQYLSCHEIEPGTLVLIGIETRAGIYEEELEIINALLAGVRFGD